MLLDSNILIYATKPAFAHLLDFMANNAVEVSAISKIEVLGYTSLTAKEKHLLSGFFMDFVIHPVDMTVIDEAVNLRQQRKMSLGDSIIAATAILHGLPLVTANEADFAWIDGLKLINPMK